MGYTFIELPQAEDAPYRLGRHVLHDDDSRAHDAKELLRPGPLKGAVHQRLTSPWDQGQVGSCTANAALGTLMTNPVHDDAGKSWKFTETDALNLYRAETRLDDRDIPGHWEPEDTGSTGLWSMKALKNAGYVKGYKWAFRFSTVLRLLVDRPISQGTTWFNSMFEPDKDGIVTVDPNSGIAGGHQYEGYGLDVENKLIWYCNSWGPSWGKAGAFALHWADVELLLHNHAGDVVVPVV